MEIVCYVVTALLAYLLGSVPTGFLVAQARGVDIRAVGSGNIGATNVLRTLGKPAGIFVLFVDALKGWVAVVLLTRLVLLAFGLGADGARMEVCQLIAALCAVLGHNYTCWLNFKGGKGIATSAGVLLALVPWALIVIFIVWIVVFALTRYVSLGSLAASAALPLASWATHESLTKVIVTGAMAALAIYKHKGNIQRLLNGTEPRFGQKRGGEVKVAVLGAGAWGTALALVLHRRLHDMVLWGHDAKHLAEMQSTGRNERYLPGVDLPRGWVFEPDMARAVAGAECAVVAVPSKVIKSSTRPLMDFRGIVVSVTKGIESETGLTMSGVLEANATRAKIAALSGPTLALEVARGVPTAMVAASRDAATAQAVQQLFHSVPLRVYTSTDLIGVEMGGALKNVVAIAAGVCDGLGFGDNSKAALLTRGIVEIRRLGVACGAQPETFAGLSGLGDLTVTCFSKLSRNRGLGERLGRGEKLEDILTTSVTVAEGYPTARAAYQLGRRLKVSTPIIDEVHAVLYEGKNVAKALRDLIERESKAED